MVKAPGAFHIFKALDDELHHCEESDSKCFKFTLKGDWHLFYVQP